MLFVYAGKKNFFCQGGISNRSGDYFPDMFTNPHFHCKDNQVFLDHGSVIEDGFGELKCGKVKEFLDKWVNKATKTEALVRDKLAVAYKERCPRELLFIYSL